MNEKEFSLEDMKMILDQWNNNMDFRREYMKNPGEALKKLGIHVSPETLKELETLKMSDEEIEKRINK